MYIPAPFRVVDDNLVSAFMRQFDFAERCEAKFKLGQNRSMADRTGAAAGLDAEQSPVASAVAEFMRRYGGAGR